MDAFLRGLFGLNHQHPQLGDPPRPQQQEERPQHGSTTTGAGGRGGEGGRTGAKESGVVIPASAAAAAAAAAVGVPVAAALVAAESSGTAELEEASSWMLLDNDENARKRSRATTGTSSDEEEGSEDRASLNRSSTSLRMTSGGARTPGLVLSPRRGDGDGGDEDEEDESQRPIKRFRGERNVIPVSPLAHSRTKKKKEVPTLQTLPDDLLAHCLSFLGGVGDRFPLQATSKKFRALSNSDAMLQNIQVGGDRQSGLHGIIREHDTPESASKNLEPYVHAGNLEAIYMLGIIKSYCHQDVEAGIRLLKYASSKGYTRASYALGLALRDGQPDIANMYMQDAANKGYIPALQEILPSRKMKAKYGEPKADELRLHLDPLCLNRLLSRYYVQSAALREANTSHCWNPLCGRWAFKATAASLASMAAAAAAANNNIDDLAAHLHHHHEFPLESPVRRGSDSSLSNGSAEPGGPAPVAGGGNGTASSPTASSSSSSTSTKGVRVSRMKMCSRCCRAKYCSKLCQVYDWRSGRHKMECQFL